MAYRVELTESEVADIATVLEAVWYQKREGPRGIRLSKEKLMEWEEQWLLSICDQLKQHEVTINSLKSNTLSWLRDQMHYVDLDRSNDTVARVLELIEHATAGEFNWRRWRNRGAYRSTMGDFFHE